jgi:hypothetical protein
VDSADVHGAAFVTPFVRLGGDFGADSLAHGLEVFEHLAQFQVAHAPDDGLGHIDGERAARVAGDWSWVLPSMAG